MIMKIAVMQPYIFPYIGYFQLLNASDKFVIYDDVNFINKGWINRNKILVNNKENLFSIPLVKSSQNKLINETEISNDTEWKTKFLKTIKTAYSKAPFFDEASRIIQAIIQNEDRNISKFILKSLNIICEYLDIDKEIVESASVYNNSSLKNQDRIIDICLKESAESYINPIGGMELYSRKLFEEKGLKINFIKPGPVQYRQFNDNFIDSLSIIDVLMFNSKQRIKELLNEYELL
jgi:WbqC-like protein family